MASQQELLTEVERLQNILVARATGSGNEEEGEYRRIRAKLRAEPTIHKRLPQFVQTCGSLIQFWQFIKRKVGGYQNRREYLWEEFRPLIELLEGQAASPADLAVTEALQAFNPDAVHEAWQRALARRQEEPEGAITAARTLLETVCKHILDDCGTAYPTDADLPTLYRLTALKLQLAPSQHTEQVFKQILGGCTAVIEGLGALRNRLGDAHGKGKGIKKPAPRHAELAVNLAGAMATFLIATWQVLPKQAVSAESS